MSWQLDGTTLCTDTRAHVDFCTPSGTTVELVNAVLVCLIAT